MTDGWSVIAEAIRFRRWIQLTDKTGNCPIRPEFDHLFAKPRLPTLEDHEPPRWCAARPCTCVWRTVDVPSSLAKMAIAARRFDSLQIEWEAEKGPLPPPY